MKTILTILLAFIFVGCMPDEVYRAKAQVYADRSCKTADGIYSIKLYRLQDVFVRCNNGTTHYVGKVSTITGPDVTALLNPEGAK